MAAKHILLVDDDRDTCASMADIFLDLGYTVDLAHEGPDALELSGRHDYRLALLDFRMPGMNGLELCRHLKVAQPGLTVALVTAFASSSTTAEAVDAGAQRIFPKPVDFSVMMPFVEAAVSKT